MIEIKKEREVKVWTAPVVSIPTCKSFTQIDSYYSNVRKDKANRGILGHYNIKELLHFINTWKEKKKDAAGFLKGIYKEGTSSEYCVRNTDYLFFDIDIDNTKQNTELFKNAYKQVELMELLQKYAVFVGRSNSGVGMFGAFLVKDLCMVSDTLHHRLIAGAVYNFIEKAAAALGIPLDLDIAQGKYRQVRFVAEQKKHLELNETPISFEYKLTDTLKELIQGVPDYVYAHGSTPDGSARDSFNKSNPIETMMAPAGLSLVSGTRYKYSGSKSSTSGELKDGIYFNNSTTFSAYGTFDSFSLGAKTLNLDFAGMYKHIKELGFKDKEINRQETREAVVKELSSEDIFKICVKFKNKKLSEKLDFINTGGIPPEKLHIYKAYLGLKNLTVQYDEILKVKRWVSEHIDTILDMADAKKKLVLVSETGTGKSTAFINEFTKHRPDGRLLFVVPLTAIADQLNGDGVIVLTGASNTFQKVFDATASPIVVATHEQATNLLRMCNTFTHLVRDEIHSDITGSSFKSTIADFNYERKNHKLIEIGLTGTPSNVLKEKGLDFYMVKIDTGRSPTQILQRTDNRDSLKIIIQLKKEVKGKLFIRVNNKDNILEAEKILLTYGYTPCQIVILDGSKQRKKSDDFKKLVNEGRFRDEVRIVIATSVIDEGVSIRNKDFATMAFIENEYHPRPEPIKQSVNRFRTKVPLIYHYRKSAKEQESREYVNIYDKDYDVILEDTEQEGVYNKSTFTSDLSNDRFKYNDGTPNPYALALKSTRDEYATYNNDEFNQFLENNYNIKIMVDKNYIEEEVIVAKKTSKEKAEARTVLYKELGDDLKTIVLRHTSDTDLLLELGMDAATDYGQIDDDTIKSIVDDLSFYEGIFKAKLALDNIIDNADVIDQFLYKDNDPDGVLAMPRVVFQKAKSLSQIRALHIKKTKNKKDRILQERLIFVKDTINDLDAPLTVSLVKRLLTGLNVVSSQNVSSRTIQDFITIETKFMYEPNKARYILKDDHPLRIKKIIKKWMLPNLSPEHIRPKSVKPPVIPFKEEG